MSETENDNIKILIADDDEDICSVLEIMLKKNYQVHVVHRGDAAWKYIEEHKPDIAILDLVMPGIDGLEICNRIKDNEELSRIRVIIITATTRDKELPDRVWQMASGADSFISKPFDANRVVQVVQDLVQSHSAN